MGRDRGGGKPAIKMRAEDGCEPLAEGEEKAEDDGERLRD